MIDSCSLLATPLLRLRMTARSTMTVMEGLEDYLQYALLNLRFDDFNHLVDSALNTERKHLEMEDKKRKIVPVASGSNTRPRLQQPQPYQQPQYRPPQQYQQRPPQQYPPQQQ